MILYLSTWACPFLQEGNVIDSSLHRQCLTLCVCHGKAKVNAGLGGREGRKGRRKEGREGGREEGRKEGRKGGRLHIAEYTHC